MNPIVSAQWLADNLENVVLLDASPKSNATGITSDTGTLTIPNSRMFNLKEDFSDPEGEFPNTFPSVEQFQKSCRKLGINSTSQIVIFDNLGIYTSPRVWWMFQAMGHENVAVLDGGLPEWMKMGFETSPRETKQYDQGNFTAHLKASNIRSYEDVLDNISRNEFTVIDARSSGRFKGTDKEPRANLQSGHIPNSINIPFEAVLESGKYKSSDELAVLFEPTNIQNQELTFSCGSGLTACIVLLAAEKVLENKKSVFDGSWTEWAERQKLFVDS